MVKNIFLALLIGAAVFCFGFLVVNGLDFEKRSYQYDATWVKEIGAITHTAQSKTRSRMSYIHNGISYDDETSYWSIDVLGCVTGEKYEILVNPKNPEKYVPIDWKPVFAPGEEKTLTRGIINGIHRKYVLTKGDSSSDYCVIFTYMTPRNEYKREQVLPPNYNARYPAIKEGASFEVAYGKENNARAIIYFDRPI